MSLAIGLSGLVRELNDSMYQTWPQIHGRLDDRSAVKVME